MQGRNFYSQTMNPDLKPFTEMKIWSKAKPLRGNRFNLIKIIANVLDLLAHYNSIFQIGTGSEL